MARPITDVRGIGPSAAKTLAEHGYRTAEDIATAERGALVKVPGFGLARAAAVQAAAREVAGGDQNRKTTAAEPAKRAKDAEKAKKKKKKPQNKGKKAGKGGKKKAAKGKKKKKKKK